MVHSGMWAKTTTGVLSERPFRSAASQASCSVPRVPRPPGLNCRDRKSTRLNSSHLVISYAVFCLKKKKNINITTIQTTSNTQHNNSYKYHEPSVHYHV